MLFICFCAISGYNLFSNRTVGCHIKDLAEPVVLAEAQPNDITEGMPTEEPPKMAYLTFDDGPSVVTEQILDVLKQQDVPASFFVIAADNNIKYLPTLKRTVAEGHCIALHSCSHAYNKIYRNTDAFWADLAALNTKLKPYVSEPPMVLRFPGGSSNTVSHKYGGSNIMKDLKQQAEAKGYIYVDWNVCARDALGGNPSPDTIARTVIKECKEKTKAVILFHDTARNKNTAAALPAIIQWLKDNDFTFDTVDHLTESF
ncbi:MAG: polysaccharide deacetylase [Oscillospiraceae bacterium]|nr:polysaccharide deacetylase [Oscillospiraceae bacterium]